MGSAEYKAFNNFIKNTCGLNKAEIHEMVKTIIQSMVEEEIRNYFKSRSFLGQITATLAKYRSSTFEDVIRADITKAVETVIREKMDELGFKFVFEKKEK
jgi:hypothetical protein